MTSHLCEAPLESPQESFTSHRSSASTGAVWAIRGALDDRPR